MDFVAALFDQEEANGAHGDADEAGAIAEHDAFDLPEPTKFGQGRHGCQMEKDRLCSHMRERKAQKTAARVAAFLVNRLSGVLMDSVVSRGSVRRNIRKVWGLGQKGVGKKVAKTALRACKLVVRDCKRRGGRKTHAS